MFQPQAEDQRLVAFPKGQEAVLFFGKRTRLLAGVATRVPVTPSGLCPADGDAAPKGGWCRARLITHTMMGPPYQQLGDEKRVPLEYFEQGLSLSSSELQQMLTPKAREDMLKAIAAKWAPPRWHACHRRAADVSALRCREAKKKPKRRKRAVESPLYKMNWLRIVLDEAHSIRDFRTQTVSEHGARRTRREPRIHLLRLRPGQSRAASALKGERRWCVTGTPFQNKLDDGFALFRFLKLTPFDHHKMCAWLASVVAP